MLLNAALLAAMLVGFNALFSKGRTQAKEWWKMIAMEVPSTHAAEDYTWLGKFPKMREWVGDRVFQNLQAFEYFLRNKNWEATVQVDRNDIEDDSFGIYAPMFESLGMESVTHYNDIALELLVGGFEALCFDGQPFFDGDHPVGETTYSNVGVAVLSAVAYNAARATMQEVSDENGRPIGVTPNLLVVGTSNEGLAKFLMTSEKLEDGTINVAKGTAEVLVVPGLGTKWFLLDTTKAIKPFIVQVRKKPDKIVALDQETQENVFMRRKFVYGVDSRDNGGYGLWQFAYGSTGAGS